ncbi:Lysine-specific demethylase [Fagus crenata]
MENSMNSMSKALVSKERTSEPAEESGWTMYFEDLLVNNNNNNENSYSSSGVETASLVSDAASLAGKRYESIERHGGLAMVKSSSKRLSFKKRKTKGANLVDDALEDTASSPLNSPKVCEPNEMDLNAIRNENTGISQEKRSASGQIYERSELGFIGRDSDCTELKKKGLCLLPLSMVVNYFG